ncbi:hypothetical protein KUV28_00710 [Ferrimonas balearica]|nr:hypothetical protein [Ferrimonas balearica]
MSPQNSLSSPHVTRRATLFGLGAGLTALALPAGIAKAQSGSGTLIYGMSTFPPSISPWQNTGATAAAVKMMWMRGLTGYSETGELQGELAESWEWNSDTQITFTLRDALFHDGSKVTAEDVVWSIEQILADDSTAYAKSSLSVIEEATALSETEVQLNLSAPFATLLQILASYNCPIVSRNSTEDNWIGSGPFTPSSSERGVFIELTRFADFYQEGAPAVETLRFVNYEDENLRHAALDTGDVDMIEFVPWQHFDAVEADPETVLSDTTGPYMFLLFNTSDPESPLSNPLVRQAIGYAINRQDIIDAAFSGLGEELFHFPNPQGSTIDIDMSDCSFSFDVARAQELLAEAGYPDGFDCTLLGTSTFSMHQDTAAVVQAYLQAIGINAQLSLPDWPTRINDGSDGNYDIAVHGMSADYNDPDALFDLLYSGNPSFLQSYGFSSDRIDELLLRGRQTLDEAERATIYAELAKAYFEECPQIPLNWRVQSYGLRDNVSGFQIFPGFLNTSSPFALDMTTKG